jgi:hypothetical protein
MGKPSAPAAPDYQPIASADETAANQQFQLGEQQLQWGQQQFNQVWPYAQQYLQQETQSSAAQTAQAGQEQQYWNNTFQPIETNFANTASNYNSPAQASLNAGNAEADVASSFDQNRQASLQQLESYGIDPSQTRYGALDLGTRISQAAATAAAGTQSNLNTQATGLALQGEAINMGEGIQNNVAQSYSTAQGAGASGINSANQTTNTGVNSMGSPTSYMGQSVANNEAAVGALNTGFNNSMAGANFNLGVSQNESQGIGSLIGGGLGLAAALI